LHALTHQLTIWEEALKGFKESSCILVEFDYSKAKDLEEKKKTMTPADEKQARLE
jgi:hypothetical protein